MHPTVQRSHRFAQAPDARAALGPDHALVAVLERQDVVERDLGAVALAAIAIVPPVVAGWRLGPWLLGSALLVALALGVGSAALRARCRELAADLLVEGRIDVPVAAVRREHDRLMAPAHRRMMARSLELIGDAARDHPAWLRSSTMPCSPITICAALPQLDELRQGLVAPRPGVRGVALAQRLLVDAGSPLRGNDAGRLREELRRICHLLADASGQPG